MKGFIGHIIDRHTGTGNIIGPRLPGRFESANRNTKVFLADDTAGGRIANNNGTLPNTETRKPSPEPDTEKTFSSTIKTANAIENIDRGHDDSREHVLPVYSGMVKHVKENPIFNESKDIQERNLQYKMPGDRVVNNEVTDSAAISRPVITTLNEPNKKNDPLVTKFSFVSPGISKPVLKEEKPGYGVKTFGPVQSSLISPGKQNNAIMSPMDFSEIKLQTVSPPVIKISIGRIEVRAISPSNVVKPTRNTAQKPGMSLDDYLKKRNNSAK